MRRQGLNDTTELRGIFFSMPAGRAPGVDVAPGALVDAHAHFHPGFDVDRYFDAASRNLERAALDVGEEGLACVLLVLETAAPTLIERLSTERGNAWRAAPTGETGSCRLERTDRRPIFVVEGRQVVTEERLEVLAVPCTGDLPDGAPLEATLAEARALAAVAILPWGVGKWFGRRGRRIAELLDSSAARGVLLGDNGGRPSLGGTPRLLSLGSQRGVPVLRGSDPLPLAAESDRVGSFGSVVSGPFDLDQPAAAVRVRLAALERTPRGFGRTSTTLGFARRQLGWRLARRRRGARA